MVYLSFRSPTRLLLIGPVVSIVLLYTAYCFILYNDNNRHIAAGVHYPPRRNYVSEHLSNNSSNSNSTLQHSQHNQHTKPNKQQFNSLTLYDNRFSNPIYDQYVYGRLYDQRNATLYDYKTNYPDDATWPHIFYMATYIA